MIKEKFKSFIIFISYNIELKNYYYFKRLLKYYLKNII